MSLPVGTVMGSEGGIYSVAIDGSAEVQATLRGRLKQDSKRGARIVVGDRVEVAEEEGAFTVESLLPRRSRMIRSGGHKVRVLAANVDRVFLVVAVEPFPWPQMIDRLLVVAAASDMPVVLVLNKVDLPAAAAVAALLTERYRAAGYPVLAMSAKQGIGVEEMRALVCQGTSAFMGPSGVGKSTILNVIEPGLLLRTSELSQKARTGRHTTVSSRLIPLTCGGLVADTPGFSDVGACDVDPAELDLCFPEMRELRDECRFGGCAHLKEPGCAVRAALAERRIAPERYESYVVLRAEAVEGRAY
ncbi:MAG: ribosome small subunit-dependent GTPase A [Gemmatimonadetes bacterium]|nr:ribosome small subunit-dependent GTPase A [Gemmatimonadota bacterium]